MLFSPGGGRFIVGISGVHVPSPHGRFLGGDLEDMKPARHTVQQTFRGGRTPGFVFPKHGLFNLFWWRRETELKKMEMPFPFE